MEHYRLRNKSLPERRFSKFPKWPVIIIGYTLGAAISLCVAIFIGFFPGGIITLLLMVIDYIGSYNMSGGIIIMPWFIESLLIFILCFVSVVINIHENLRR